MNWGNKILLAFVAFFLVIGTLVYKSFHTKSELVSSEYYKDEIEYQKVINGSQNVNSLSSSLKVENSNRKLKIVFPKEIIPNQITGTVWLYCAYESKNDLRFPLNVNSIGEIQYDSTFLKPGQYLVKVSLDNKGTNYFIQKDILILQ